MKFRVWPVLVLTLVMPAAGGADGDPRSDRPYTISEEREPCANYDKLRRPHFGDTHVHTAYSFDASTQDTRGTPADAYRFARGARLGIQPYNEEGKALRHIQLQRPLDFVAVTDHAELLGDVRLCMTPGSSGYSSIICWIHRNWPSLAFRLIASRTMILRSHWGLCGDDWADCIAASGEVWRSIQQAAEDAYDRSAACEFTSFVAYEWTATMDDGKNLHRNVLFRNERVPDLPISWVDTPSATDLWDQLEAKCIEGKPGCDALTIPHNSNISAGLMFESASIVSSKHKGREVDAEEARRRARWEPLIEIMQHKGDSECQPGGATSDEACGFEKLPYDRFGPKFSMWAVDQPATSTGFVRPALGKGLQQQARLGANALKYGIVASTDTHIAAPGLTAEKSHPGHGGAGMGAGEGLPVGFPDDLEFSPGGLAVLWAEENTRDSLFSAMQRREAYGTSGTRPVVRFFASWDYPDDLCDGPDFVARAYEGGVPMGSDLPPRPGDEPDAAPHLALWALKDPGTGDSPGTLLQRYQVVKGWLDAAGEFHEKVIDVAGGPNDASVDINTCEQHGPGAESLCAVWRDPDFDPDRPAFYYGRVLENPSCRWSQYICNAANVECNDTRSIPDGLTGCCTEDHHSTQQERAWTSPIWVNE